MAIIYDNHINVQEIFWEILTHTFVPAFSGTHGINDIALKGGFLSANKPIKSGDDLTSGWH